MFDKIILNPTDMLVDPLRDYYTKVQKGAFNTSVNGEEKYHVGIIVHAGEKVQKEFIGKVIFYHKNIAMEVDFKSMGKFFVVTESLKVLIRTDQNKNNY